MRTACCNSPRAEDICWHGGRYDSRATASPAPSLGQVEPQKLSHRACGMSTQCWHHTQYSVLHFQTLITILNSLSLTFHPNWGLLVQMNPSGPGLFHKVLRESRRTKEILAADILILTTQWFVSDIFVAAARIQIHRTIWQNKVLDQHFSDLHVQVSAPEESMKLQL